MLIFDYYIYALIWPVPCPLTENHFRISRMSRHTIRLAGPWLLPDAPRHPGPEFRRNLPVGFFHVGTSDLSPRSILRRFHRPTGLTPHSILWLWLDVAATGHAAAFLNGKQLECRSRETLADGERLVFQLNAELADFNELEVTLGPIEDASAGAVLSAAALVIDG